MGNRLFQPRYHPHRRVHDQERPAAAGTSDQGLVINTAKGLLKEGPPLARFATRRRRCCPKLSDG